MCARFTLVRRMEDLSPSIATQVAWETTAAQPAQKAGPRHRYDLLKLA